MTKFLIDINLPYYFALWNSNDFIHQKDLDSSWSDEEIWQYAKINNLTIITKDVDFSNKIMLHNPPPKVIHIRFGNLKIKPFYKVITNLWDKVLDVNSNYKLVNVFADRIEGIE
jgi:predicted nuclease of predicted toxin-antitoxin system